MLRGCEQASQSLQRSMESHVKQQDRAGDGRMVWSRGRTSQLGPLTGAAAVTYMTEALKLRLTVLKAIVFIFLVLHMHKIREHSITAKKMTAKAIRITDLL